MTIPHQSKNLYIMNTLLDNADCQGGGAVTQSPAERFSPGSNPDLGFFKFLNNFLSSFE